jgi:hypothetical protein
MTGSFAGVHYSRTEAVEIVGDHRMSIGVSFWADRAESAFEGAEDVVCRPGATFFCREGPVQLAGSAEDDKSV